MHGSMGGGRKPLTVGYAVRQRAPLAYPTNPVPSAAESERKGPSGRGVCGGVGLAVGIVVGVCVRSESVVCAEFRCVSSSRVWGVCDAAFV